MMLGREAISIGTLRIKSKPFPPPSSDGFLLKANLRTSSINGSQTNLKMTDKKQLKLIDRKERKHDMVADSFALETALKEDKRIFSQNFTISSYDVGPNHATTIETLMNLLQETALNNLKSMGLLRDGFGSTPEMSQRNLIWVPTKMHVVIDRYPSWREDVQVNNWFILSGKNGMSVEWIMCDGAGQTLARASSMIVIMNKETRKLSKMPEGVRKEMEPQCIECQSIVDGDGSKIPKLDYRQMKHVRTGLIPRWNDLDVNQHVFNVKYVGLMSESVPVSFLESYELIAITVEYKRECAMGDVLQSLTSVCDETIDGSIGSGGINECFHLLCFENGVVVARARTKWSPKQPKN